MCDFKIIPIYFFSKKILSLVFVSLFLFFSSSPWREVNIFVSEGVYTMLSNIFKDAYKL